MTEEAGPASRPHHEGGAPKGHAARLFHQREVIAGAADLLGRMGAPMAELLSYLDGHDE